MEFFDRIEQLGHMGKKGGSEKAAGVLSKLATAVADAPEASDLELNKYNSLYIQRMGKAKRAYVKAVNALTASDVQACIEHAERGLLHLQIASIHAHTDVVQLSANEAGGQDFPSGGCEECIQLLADAICQIKLLAEYKSIEVSKELRSRLSNVVQNLQDAIETYGNADYRLAFDTALGGLVWCQYIYARLGGDALFSPKLQTKPIRSLYKLAWDMGLAAFDPVSRQTKDGRKKVIALEGFLQSAVAGYLENDLSEVEKFVRLGEIEATSLIRYVARTKTKDLVSAMQSCDRGETRPAQSFKQIICEIRDLVDRHHPKPDKALVALEAFQLNIGDLRRAMRAENWQDAKGLIDACRCENEILSREAARLTE